jgi:hypothetical protein
LNQLPYGVELAPARAIERPRVGICLGDFVAVNRVFDAISMTSPLISTLAKHYDASDARANIFRRRIQH